MAEMPVTLPVITKRDSTSYICEFCPGTQVYIQDDVPWIITPDTPPMLMIEYIAALVTLDDGRKHHPAHEGKF